MTWFGIAGSGEILHSTADDGLYDFGPLVGDVVGILGATSVEGIKGIPLATGLPAAGQILKFDGSQWSYAPDDSGVTPALHALLGAEHSDTVTASPVRGDIIFGNAGGLWDSLSVGTDGFVVYSDGTDVLYTRLGQNTPFSLGTPASPGVTFVGDISTGLSAQTSGVLEIGAVGTAYISVNGSTDTVTLDAGLVYRTTTVGADYALLNRDYAILCTTGGITITLPSAPVEGRVIFVKDRDGNAATGTPNRILVSGNGNNIDGNTQIRIRRAYGSFTLMYSGAEWNVI